MAKEYESFLDELKTICPELPEGDVKNITNDSSLSTLEDFTKAKFVNYNAKRKDLYKLSMDIEAYAVKNYVPLLATFETENLYKYVQKRYTEILKKIPHAWVIGGFDDPFLIPPDSVPATAEILSCLDTNIEKMWIVVTKGPNGPFGPFVTTIHIFSIFVPKQLRISAVAGTESGGIKNGSSKPPITHAWGIFFKISVYLFCTYLYSVSVSNVASSGT